MTGTTIGAFSTFVAPEKENPYIATFEEFAKVSEKNPETAWTVELPANKETSERMLIAAAAHNVNKTARLRKRDDSKRTVVGNKEKSGNPVYQGSVTLTFTLSEKHKPRRGSDVAAPAEAETNSK